MPRISLAICSLILLASPSAFAQTSTQPQWTGSWASAQQIPEPQNALPSEDLRDATLRQIVHLSLGGSTLRIRLSNAFGTAPLHLSSVHIARPLSPSTSTIDPTTDKPLNFSGERDVTIPAGADYLSDPVDFPAPPLSNLAITLHLDEPPTQQTSHPGSRATSYLVHGNQVSAPDLQSNKPEAVKKIDHWFFLSGVDVMAPSTAAIVALGDSITDGHAATTNGNDRWPDILAQRLAASSHPLGVLNLGIGGNHLLTDGLGPNALARFDRDVLAQSNVRTVILLEGVNDLGGLARQAPQPPAVHQSMVQHILAAYQQILDRAHAHGLMVIGATILPYTGSDYYHPSPADEQDRQSVNSWIRAAGHFDAIVDFDQLLADAAHPDRLLPTYDSGDHLHPSPAGYAKMGQSIPLALLMP
jgi:lysophospholipase L1-like esterase